MTKIPEERRGPWAVSAEATDTPEGRRFSVTLSVPAGLAIEILNKFDVVRGAAVSLMPPEVAEHMNLVHWMENVFQPFEVTSPGRPPKADTPLLYELGLAQTKDPSLTAYKFLMVRSSGDNAEYERLKKQLQRERKVGDKN